MALLLDSRFRAEATTIPARTARRRGARRGEAEQSLSPGLPQLYRMEGFIYLPRNEYENTARSRANRTWGTFMT
ncbi:hypothetical protein, partial [Acidiphilium sp.]|uniref:hypothetical protein n=1 Tax=Acidiphilium sp. TaxID=527 RepID=UPI00258D8E0C